MTEKRFLTVDEFALARRLVREAAELVNGRTHADLLSHLVGCHRILQHLERVQARAPSIYARTCNARFDLLRLFARHHGDSK